MRKLINLSIVLVMVLGFLPVRTATAEVTPLWEQLPGGDNAVVSAVGNYIVADDFVVTNATTIGQLEFWSSIPGPIEINIKFYENGLDGSGNNKPDGDPLYSISLNSTGSPEESSICSQPFCTYRHTIVLNTPVNLITGRYWVSIYGSSTLFWSYDSTQVDGSAKSGYWWNGEWSILVRNLAFRLIEEPETCPVIVVTSTADSGPGSLRQAIADVCSGGTIMFDLEPEDLTITLDSELTITKDLTIDGLVGDERVTISGNKSVRVFNVSSGTVTLDRLNIIDGYKTGYPGGGGIRNAGTLLVKNSTLSSNHSSYGGAIFNANVGQVSVINCNIEANTAQFGGGISNHDAGSIIIMNSVITSNTALTNGSGGGIVNNATTGELTIIDSTLSNNSSEGGGGGIYALSSTTTVLGSTLVGNQSSSTLQGGGGIFNSQGTMTVVNSTLVNNTSVALGGGIRNVYSATLTLFNSTFSGNHATGSSHGSGLRNDSESVLHIANTIIANSPTGDDCNNQATIATNINNLVGDGTCSEGSTGFRSGDPLLAPLADKGGPTWTMALQPGSPAIDAGDNVICGGELVDGVDQRGAQRDVGPSCDIGAYEYGGMVTLPPPKTLVVNATDDEVDSICDETHCSLREAVLSANSGDTITFDESLSGETIELNSNISITKDLTIVGPGADQLAISGSRLDLHEEFDPTDDGGVFKLQALWSNDLGQYQPIHVDISGLTIKDGRAWAGGGIYNGYHCSLELSDCVIGPNNVVTEAGGGLANVGGNLVVNRCTVEGNHGTGTIGGAGIFTYNGGETTLINSTVTGNVTNNDGGGILAYYGGIVNLVHTTVTGNVANDDYDIAPYGGGGGIYITAGTVTIKNSIVAGNTDKSLENKRPDVSGEFDSLGGNLIGDDTGSTGWVGDDLVGTYASPINPMLDSLALNEPGSTHTHALLPGSPAIDKVVCPIEITTDQRGVPRPQPEGGPCDIGAFELEQTITYGDLKITKVFDPLTSGFTGTFEIDFTCDIEGYFGTVYLAAGGSMTFYDIPSGTECTVTEKLPIAPAGWTFETPTFSPADGKVIISETTVEVIVTNTISFSLHRIFLPLVMGGGAK